MEITISQLFFLGKINKNCQVVWPVDILYLLNPQTATSMESLDKRAESVDLLCTTPTGEQEHSQERTCSENQTKETPHRETLPSENTCECGKEIGELKSELVSEGLWQVIRISDFSLLFLPPF